MGLMYVPVNLICNFHSLFWFVALEGSTFHQNFYLWRPAPTSSQCYIFPGPSGSMTPIKYRKKEPLKKAQNNKIAFSLPVHSIREYLKVVQRNIFCLLYFSVSSNVPVFSQYSCLNTVWSPAWHVACFLNWSFDVLSMICRFRT